MTPPQGDRKRQIWRHHFDKCFEALVAGGLVGVGEETLRVVVDGARQVAVAHANEMVRIEEEIFNAKAKE